MGIRGLTAFVKQGSLSSIADHVDLSIGCNDNSANSLLHHHVIVIDGNAFSHWFCMEILGSAPSLNTNYKILKENVVAWIEKCYNTKVKCIFVFDGVTESDKLQCRLDRLCKQSANMNFALPPLLLCTSNTSTTGSDKESNNYISNSISNIKSNISNSSSNINSNISNNNSNNINIEGSNSSSNKSHNIKLQSTPPLLAISCIINAIRGCHSLGCRSFYADGEADKIVVEVAVALKATAIMSNDSDMLIYDTLSVGFIPFWAFGFANDGSLNAFVIKRRKLANLLGIKESSLPLLAALVGNDFTSPETCYNMHKILFEGYASVSKIDKTRPMSDIPLSLDELGLSYENIHDNVSTESDGKRQKIPSGMNKPKKRNDSSLDRMKERRRANRLDEDNKRKANHITRNSIENFNESKILNNNNNSNKFIDDDIKSEANSEGIYNLQTNMNRGGGGSKLYGESGIKTVRAAAEFLKKSEFLKKTENQNDVLSAGDVTACLLNISIEDVTLSFAKAQDCSLLSKVESLCISFLAAFNDSIVRYQFIHTNDHTKTPSHNNNHYNDNDSKDSTTNSIKEKDEISAPITTMCSKNKSKLRCCYRCCFCIPLCQDMYSNSLYTLLHQSDVSIISTPSLFPPSISTSILSFVNNEILPLSPPLLSKTHQLATAVTSSTSSLTVISTVASKSIRFSPDLEQICRYKMFIGRTPCSLLNSSATHPSHTNISLTSLSNFSTISLPIFPIEIPLMNTEILKINKYAADINTVKNTKENNKYFKKNTSDYVLLQPLRRRLYHELYGNKLLTFSSKNDTLMTEIFKKDSSCCLERHIISLDINDMNHNDNNRNNDNNNKNDRSDTSNNSNSKNNNENNNAPSASPPLPFQTRLMLIKTVNKLIFSNNPPVMTQFLTTSSDSISKIISPISRERIENQLLFIILTTGLFIDMSKLENVIQQKKEKENENHNNRNKNKNNKESASEEYSNNIAVKLASKRMVKQSEYYNSDINTVFLTAVAFLISCTITLIYEEIKNDNNNNNNDNNNTSPNNDPNDNHRNKNNNSNNTGNHKNSTSNNRNSNNISDEIHSNINNDKNNKNINLPFINTWTRIQVCVQHINYSIEIAGASHTFKYTTNQLQQEKQLAMQYGLGGVNKESINKNNNNDNSSTNNNNKNKNNAKYDNKNNKMNDDFTILKKLLLGFDIGLLDPFLFSHVNSLLQPIESIITPQINTNEIDKNKEINAIIENIHGILLHFPLQVTENIICILKEAIEVFVTFL